MMVVITNRLHSKPSPFREIGAHDYIRGDLTGITARTDKTVRLKLTSHNTKNVKVYGISEGVKY